MKRRITPDFPFPGYFAYVVSDNGGDVVIKITNSGNYGAFLTLTGTKIVFRDPITSVAYAAIIKSVNGTELYDNQDSLLIDSGEIADLVFHPPTTHPSPGGGLGTAIIVNESYEVYLFVTSYDERGQIFTKNESIGLSPVLP